MFHLINLVIFYIFIGMLLLSVYILLSKSIINIALSMGAYSICCAIFYVIVGAPDVALTESVVGAGLSTTLSFITILVTKPSNDSYIHININKDQLWYKIVLTIILFTTFIFFVIALSSLPPFGNIENPSINETYFLYVTQSYDVYKIQNIVTMILGSFRGFDTLGEVLVIFTATVAVIALIQQGKTKN